MGGWVIFGCGLSVRRTYWRCVWGGCFCCEVRMAGVAEAAWRRCSLLYIEGLVEIGLGIWGLFCVGDKLLFISAGRFTICRSRVVGSCEHCSWVWILKGVACCFDGVSGCVRGVWLRRDVGITTFLNRDCVSIDGRDVFVWIGVFVLSGGDTCGISCRCDCVRWGIGIVW